MASTGYESKRPTLSEMVDHVLKLLVNAFEAASKLRHLRSSGTEGLAQPPKQVRRPYRNAAGTATLTS